MEGKIGGSWPGGPKREGEPQKRSGPPRLQRVEEIEAQMANRSLRRRRGSRQKRVVIGLAFSVLLAGGVGWVLGLRSHQTLEELRGGQAQREAASLDMSTEINKVMMELWKMEDVEYSRNRGGR